MRLRCHFLHAYLTNSETNIVALILNTNIYCFVLCFFVESDSGCT